MKNQRHEETALEKWERPKAEGQPIAEHILNILKAGLSAAPFAGAIASLMTDYIPASKTKRLEEFAEQIAKDTINSLAMPHTYEKEHSFQFIKANYGFSAPKFWSGQRSPTARPVPRSIEPCSGDRATLAK